MNGWKTRAAAGLAAWFAMVGAGVPVGAGPAETAEADTPPVVAERQQLMVRLIKATKVPRAMVKGERDHDPAAVRAAMAEVITAAAALPGLFPEGSGEGSHALPTVWDTRADFDARLAQIEPHAAALAFAADAGPDALASAFAEYIAVCDGCHAVYRKPE
ncbi:c-type cytochrome [Methylobrevis pamukkalensis]|uniref:Cytochrome c-556 n=1 Tax=Methylobrevis pamukkalensis TaxID=1439726 RepID=A0A1E3H634_9HYPH|nr:cytochrome c [Methylobrevis pamukkalensis]ODN71798.1 Cytochrome c-556 [Methylobrevis pamukkalensis]